MKASIEWAMPNRWTFQIPPIRSFVERWLEGASIIVDPFAGTSKYATHSNDWGQGGLPADEWLQSLLTDGLQADAVIFDPPYSARQISECYKSIGLRADMKATQTGVLYASTRPLLARLCKPGGISLSFGWQSSGLGKPFGPIEELLLVQHGGPHYDTICVAQRKTQSDILI